jgi:hypothetical protein
MRTEGGVSATSSAGIGVCRMAGGVFVTASPTTGVTDAGTGVETARDWQAASKSKSTGRARFFFMADYW